MTSNQKLLLERYAHFRKKQSARIRLWRIRHPEYERSDKRRAYKKAWAQAQRQNRAFTNHQIALQS